MKCFSSLIERPGEDFIFKIILKYESTKKLYEIKLSVLKGYNSVAHIYLFYNSFAQ
jgi:hypothetical protein